MNSSLELLYENVNANKFIKINDENTTGDYFCLKRLIYYFNKIDHSIKNDSLQKQLVCFVSSAFNENQYNIKDLADISEELIKYYKKYIDNINVNFALISLCQVYWSIIGLCYKHEIAHILGSHIKDHWHYYKKYFNGVIDDLLHHYYYFEFYNFIEKNNPTAQECIQKVKNDQFLMSEDGLYQKKTILMKMHQWYFYDRDDELEFLKAFEDDSTVKKRLNQVLKMMEEERLNDENYND